MYDVSRVFWVGGFRMIYTYIYIYFHGVVMEFFVVSMDTGLCRGVCGVCRVCMYMATCAVWHGTYVLMESYGGVRRGWLALNVCTIVLGTLIYSSGNCEVNACLLD